MCYHVKFGSSAIKVVRINGKEPPKLGSPGLQLPGTWIQYTNVTDRQTDPDRQTPGDSKDRVYA